MSTDTSERGLERLICTALTGHACDAGFSKEGMSLQDSASPTATAGWICGAPQDYDREYCVDIPQLVQFLQSTQLPLVEGLDLAQDSLTRQKFLGRLQGEITSRGVIDVLRKGIKHGNFHIDLFYGSPSEGNPKAQHLYSLNRFSVTRQLRYSRDDTRNALDMGLFINGLPVATFELKNNLTKQTVEDAVQQYKSDRDPREKLFEFGRCAVHFAVDDQEVRFCTHLKGKASWFLPFNKGYQDGAGNPPNPQGIKTDYLWKEVLQKDSLTDILENFAQIVETKDEKTGKKKTSLVWPRYHQLRVVRKLKARVQTEGVGNRYMIQHSAGSGKSNSIAWTAHQLVPFFDSIIVVTDRRILDKQIKDTIKGFAQVSSIVGHAQNSGDLRKFISQGKKIIITTVQKFPFILAEIGDDHRDNKFAILIDEAHSSQGGKASTAISRALQSQTAQEEEDDSPEDEINRIMEGRKLLPNASYFAFTATPKNKTLEIFGTPEPQPDGRIRHVPVDSYTMKQAIQEGFILDVLKNYTPVSSYYKLMKKIEEDPEFDTKKAKKKLRRYVEGNDHAIRLKAEIMVDHFHESVLNPGKIGGQARAMVVTNGIERAIQYFHAFQEYLSERKSPLKPIVAFSGEYEWGGKKITEADLNGFPSNDIPDRIQTDPYRFLICADKFQTGYDEPLLHTMYVDKTLSSIKAVQTLSRLNRAHPQKFDTFVLDFMNDPDSIKESFDPFYRTTILSDETDPNKLHDLKADLDKAQVYTEDGVNHLVELYLNGAERHRLDPHLDGAVEVYINELDEDAQVDFKGKAKAFLRTYNFLSSILPFSDASWEKLSIFLTFLIPKLPAPKEEDLSQGILESIDMDSYRVEKKATMKILLTDADAEIDPFTGGTPGGRTSPELDRLSNIVRNFNEQFGNIQWTDEDRIIKRIMEEIPQRVADDQAYQNAKKNSDKQNARVEHDKAIARVITSMMKDDTELFKQFFDNPSFRRFVTDMVFDMTYDSKGA